MINSYKIWPPGWRAKPTLTHKHTQRYIDSQLLNYYLCEPYFVKHNLSIKKKKLFWIHKLQNMFLQFGLCGLFSSFYHLFWTDRWWGNARVSSWRFRNAAQLVMGILCGICWTAGAAKFSHQSPLTIGKFAWLVLNPQAHKKGKA